jgi:transcriptional regulator with XRE-family HTH domain
MNSHDHEDFEIKTQKHLVESGIKKAGGVCLFAKHMGVTRHTVSRWVSGKHNMSGHYLYNLMAWLKRK